MSARILMAEDNLEIRSFIADYLTMKGFRVDAVEDGAQLVQKAAALLPDLIITDVQMPGAFGSTAYLELQKDDRLRNIPVIFISAHGVGEMVPKDPKVRFLLKPLELKQLERLIAELLPPRPFSAGL